MVFAGLTAKAFGIGAWSAAKAVFKFFTTPVGKFLGIVILFLAFGAWTYHRAEVNTTARYEKVLKSQEDAALAAAKFRREESKKVHDALQAELDAEKARRQQVKVVIKKVKEYVTPEADARAVVPVGFVFVHNVALDVDLADSPPRDVDAPSGIALSEVAETVAWNYDEAVYRGQLLEAWQAWYVKNKAIFEEAERLQKETIAKNPP